MRFWKQGQIARRETYITDEAWPRASTSQIDITLVFYQKLVSSCKWSDIKHSRLQMGSVVAA